MGERAELMQRVLARHRQHSGELPEDGLSLRAAREPGSPRSVVRPHPQQQQEEEEEEQEQEQEQQQRGPQEGT